MTQPNDPMGGPESFPPSLPPDPFGQSGPVDYFPRANDNAPTLVRLAVIFNYISAGLDICLVLFGAGLSALFLSGSVPQNAGDPPPMFLGIVYLIIGLLALGIGIVKFIGTRRLSRGGQGAWGWGLALGIIGCAQFLLGSCICLQVAAGVYTIVIICFSNVKNHLQFNNQQPAEPDPMNAAL